LVVLSTLALYGGLARYAAMKPLTAAGASTIYFMLVFALWLIPKWQVPKTSDPGERFDRENEARKTLSTIFGGLALLIGFYFTWQNLKAAQESLGIARDNLAESEKATGDNLSVATEGLTTDRYTKAIAQLGDTKLEVRLGGIYALERIANDPKTDLHWSVMEVLITYVREHTGSSEAKQMPMPGSAIEPLDPEIQAILTVIGRRKLTYKKGEEHPINLGSTVEGSHTLVLMAASLNRANLSGAILTRINLGRADLRDADLSGVNLEYAGISWAQANGVNLNMANLHKAYAYGANLSKAHLEHANLINTNFKRASLEEADLRGANLGGTDFEGANLKGADLRETVAASWQLEVAVGNAKTKLPTGVPRPKSWQ